MRLKYENGENDYWFVIFSLYISVLLPISCCCLCCKKGERETVAHGLHLLSSYQHTNRARRKQKKLMSNICLVAAWLVLGLLASYISSLQTGSKEYDPFAILNADRDASIDEIKRIYRVLSKIHHPDRGGNPERFKEIVRAHNVLTDARARKNWEKYGNPDGPTMFSFNYGVPNYLLDPGNVGSALFISMVLLFIVLPIAFLCLIKILF